MSDDDWALAQGTVDARNEERMAAHGRFTQPPSHRLYVNDERTVLVRLWASGTVEVATRKTPAHVWEPPVYLTVQR